MKNKQKQNLLGILSLVGMAGLLIWVYRKEKKSNLILDDIGQVARPSNALQFTMKNTTGSPQSVTIFNGYSLKPIQQQNPNIQISSNPSLEYFIRTLSTQPKRLSRVEVRTNNAQQLIKGFNMLAKDANGKQVRTTIFPMVSAMQVQSNIAIADLSGIVLDAQTVINRYTLMPNTSVTMIIFWD